MKTIHFLVEGPTEEKFIKTLIQPFCQSLGLRAEPIIVFTQKEKSGRKFKGGHASYQNVREDILRLLYDTSAVLVTTLIDFYGLPGEYPGKNKLPRGDCYDQVQYLEQMFAKDINHRKFIPFFMLYEFEGLLFSSPDDIARFFPGQKVLQKFRKIKNSFPTPEKINGGKETHPSARISRLLPEYRKALHGPLIATQIGLEKIRHECPHFNEWLLKLEQSEQV